MDALIVMLKNVIIFVLLALPGFFLVKSKQLKAEQSGALSKLLTYVGMPFLTISSTLNLSFNGEVVITIFVVAVIALAYALLAIFATKLFTAKERNEKTRGMMRFAAVFANSGFLGLPLVMAVFGADSPVMTVAIVLNIVNNVLMYTLGVYLISGDKKAISVKKALFNPIIIAFVAGVLLNLFKVKDFLPEVVTYSTHFSGIVTPVSMTVLGMKMGEIRFKELFTSLKLYYVAALKLFVIPVVIAGIAFALQTLIGGVFTQAVTIGLFTAFAMPTAGLASTFSDQYDGDTPSAVSFTLGTTVLSVITIPTLYWVLTMIL